MVWNVNAQHSMTWHSTALGHSKFKKILMTYKGKQVKSFSPPSQLGPTKSTGQEHVYCASPSRQVPPFWHGLL